MTFTKREQDTIFAVISGLLTTHSTQELNTFLGSETIKEMSILYSKLKFEPFCARHGIRFEDMDEYDYETAYREEWEV